jgi:sarcosine oxidase gamma subunit
LDDRYLAVNYGGVAAIIDAATERNGPAPIRGNHLCWIGPGEFIIESEAGVDAFTMASGAQRTILRNAASPQCIGGAR